ncbi:MAG: hypothetical protein CL610_21160 [Anaerolineaceae bacterium]|nr:hypothetical protein [Anaerolineaceae bacterium]
MKFRRLPNNPIITAATPGADPDMSNNINGPSLIRVPHWVTNPLGQYYLYFAHHHGQHIRMAYADNLSGPWQIHEPGVLHLEETRFIKHIASPDAYIDHERQQIRLYYHGPVTPEERAQVDAEIDSPGFRQQRSRMAVSADGLHFTEQPPLIAFAYLRVFDFKGMIYGMTMPGLLYRSPDGFGPFEAGPLVLGDDANREAFYFSPGQPSIRHLAVQVDGDTLRVFYSRAGDEPECILMTEIDAHSDNWHDWRPSPAQVIFTPDEPWEGADLPLKPSVRGSSLVPVRELRDPAIYAEDGRTYLLYSVAGEQGIAIAEVV